MEDLKPAIEYSTYKEYCAPRLQLKMGVMPESLFDLIHLTAKDDEIVTDELPRHGSPQDRGSADAYYQRPYDPHYYAGDSMQSERVGKDDMTEEEITAYKYGYDNEDDRKEW